MMMTGETQQRNNLQLTIDFARKCFAINRESDDYLDGVVVLGVIISMFENMHAKLDQDLDKILEVITDELFF
jgi:hypothetical protein